MPWRAHPGAMARDEGHPQPLRRAPTSPEWSALSSNHDRKITVTLRHKGLSLTGDQPWGRPLRPGPLAWPPGMMAHYPAYVRFGIAKPQLVGAPDEIITAEVRPKLADEA